MLVDGRRIAQPLNLIGLDPVHHNKVNTTLVAFFSFYMKIRLFFLLLLLAIGSSLAEKYVG